MADNALPLVYAPPADIEAGYFVDSVQARECWECAVCRNIMGQSISFCVKGHSFCLSCCKRLTDNRCPLCNLRNQVKPYNKLVPNRALVDTIGMATVRCFTRVDFADGNNAAGMNYNVAAGAACDWTGRFRCAASHFAVCKFVGAKCTNEGCDEVVLRIALLQHQQTCAHRTQSCSWVGCGLLIKVTAIELHEQHECPKRVVPCTNADAGCCAALMCFDELPTHLGLDCALEPVACPWAALGCTVPCMPRNQVEAHKQEHHKQHADLLAAVARECREAEPAVVWAALLIVRSSQVATIEQRAAALELRAGAVQAVFTGAVRGADFATAVQALLTDEPEGAAPVALLADGASLEKVVGDVVGRTETALPRGQVRAVLLALLTGDPGLLDLSTCEGAVGVLRSTPLGPAAATAALYAIGQLGRDAASNLSAFNRLGACELVCGVLSSPLVLSSSAATALGCDAVRALANGGAYMKDKLVASGAGAAVVAAMGAWPDDAAVAQYGCQAIESMAAGSSDTRRDKLVASRACGAVLAALEALPGNVAVAQHGCGAIRNLAAGSIDAIRAELMASRSCKAVADAMRAFPGDAVVAQCGCGAIRNLSACSSVAIRAELVELGASKAVADAMGAFPGDAVVAQHGCGAIWSLANGSSDTTKSQLVVEFGAGAAVVAALQARPGDALVAQNGCGAIRVLAAGSSDATKSQLMASGAGKAVAAALQARPDDAAVAQHGCGAIQNLANGSSVVIKSQLMASGAGKAVAAALQARPGDAAVARNGCGAIWDLAAGISDTTKSQLVVEFGAGAAVVAALEALPGDAAVAQNGCGAIRNLAAGSSDATKSQLMASGACEAVVKALQVLPDDAVVAQQACRAILNLVSGSSDATKLKLMELGAGKAVVAVLQARPDDVVVAQCGCGAIRNLANCSSDAISDAIRAKLVELGAGEAMLGALQAWPHDAAVAQQAYGAIGYLADGSSNDIRAQLVALLAGKTVTESPTLPAKHRAQDLSALQLRARHSEEPEQPFDDDVSVFSAITEDVTPESARPAVLCEPQQLRQPADHHMHVFAEDPALQLQAMQQFRRLLSIERNPPIQQVIESDVVPRFVQFLQQDANPPLQFEAAWALTNIASGMSDHTRVVVDAGAVPILIRLLTSPNMNIREQAVWALGNVAGDSVACRDLVLQSGALPALVVLGETLTEQSLQPLTRQVARTLKNLCRGKPPPQFEVVRPVLPLLAKLLCWQDMETATDACWALSYLSDGPNERIQAVLTAGVAPRLVELLGSTTSSVQTPALRTVGNIVSGDDSQTQVMIDLNAMPALLLLLDHSDGNIRKEACWTLSNVMAGTADQIQSVINAGVLPKLVELLRSADANVQKEATRAVANATCGTPEQVLYLEGQGVVPPLCALLTVADVQVVTVALKGLENMLQAAQTGDGNVVAETIARVGGRQAIERLRTHEDGGVSQRAVTVTETHFNALQAEFSSLCSMVSSLSAK